MKKEYTLTKESIEYWKEDFRYMAGEGSITFREYITGSAGSGPELDASLGMWGPGDEDFAYRGMRFHSQHPPHSFQLPLTPIQTHPMPPSDLCCR